MTPDQIKGRQRKEIYTNSGTPEKSVASGMYRRAYVVPRSRGPRLERDHD